MSQVDVKHAATFSSSNSLHKALNIFAYGVLGMGMIRVWRLVKYSSHSLKDPIMENTYSLQLENIQRISFRY